MEPTTATVAAAPATPPTSAQRREAHAHYAASAVGGFLGLFPVVSAAHLFGSAQTANLIELVVAALGGNVRALLLHAAGAALCCAAVVLATVLPKRTRVNVRLAAMLIDVAAAVVIWRIPGGLPPTMYLYPTFFAMAFQWCAFRGAYGFVSASIFSTNNLRMCVSALAEVLANGDRSFSLKARFFGATLLSFHCGVAASWLCWHALGNAGFLCVLAPIAVCTALVLRERTGVVEKRRP